MIVADVNLVIYLLTDSPRRESALSLYQRDPEWWLPPLWRHEYLNVLATLTRKRAIREDESLSLWRNGLAVFSAREREPDPERALQLAIAHRISAYDAQYVALADAFGCRLVTADKRLLRAFPETCRHLDAPG